MNKLLTAYISGRTLVFDRRTFPILRLTNSWTGDHFVGKLSANEANSAFHPSTVDKWVVTHVKSGLRKQTAEDMVRGVAHRPYHRVLLAARLELHACCQCRLKMETEMSALSCVVRPIYYILGITFLMNKLNWHGRLLFSPQDYFRYPHSATCYTLYLYCIVDFSEQVHTKLSNVYRAF